MLMVGHIYDVKIWRQTSNFDVGRQIGSKMTVLSLIWAILMVFLACMVISNIPIDHMITTNYFMPLKWVKSALNGIIQKITIYALYSQSRDPNPPVKIHLESLVTDEKPHSCI